jgi:hypothetical protein
LLLFVTQALASVATLPNANAQLALPVVAERAEDTLAHCETPKRIEKHCDEIAIMPLARNLEFAPVNKFTCDFSLFYRFSFPFLVFRSLIRIFVD